MMQFRTLIIFLGLRQTLEELLVPIGLRDFVTILKREWCSWLIPSSFLEFTHHMFWNFDLDDITQIFTTVNVLGEIK